MSFVRKHFWKSVKRVPSGCFSPNKYGTNGCIPAVVNNTDGSFSGINGALGITACPCLLKKSKYLFLISIAFI